MTPLRGLGALALAAVCAAAVAAASRAPFSPEPVREAAIRFAWRASSEPIQRCRTPSAEELARLPVHMRRKQICERNLPTSHLEVSLDGEARLDAHIPPRGAERDRPGVVLRELRVAPGQHRLAVEFEAEHEGARVHELETELALEAGEVALVTLDESGALVVRRKD